jgi:hypothetical protein
MYHGDVTWRNGIEFSGSSEVRVDIRIVRRCWFLRKKRTSCDNESDVLFSLQSHCMYNTLHFTTKSVPQEKKNTSYEIDKLFTLHSH